MTLARAQICARLLAVACLGLSASCGGAAAVKLSEFLTSEMGVRTFEWGNATRSVAQAFENAFPSGNGSWADLSFTDASDSLITKEVLFAWIEEELLGGRDPFAAQGGRVPVPWPGVEGLEDQLAPNHWVAYSRRQVCFVVAKSLIGATTLGYANGLLRYLEKVSNGGCQARQGDFGRAFFVFLGACAADPGLADGGQGPLLVVVKASVAPEVQAVRVDSHHTLMESAGLRVCQYDDGIPEEVPMVGASRVPAAGCSQPTNEGPGTDFMTATGLPGQAVQDISAAFLGGYVYGYACGLGGGQDERLMTYMPEVAALTFFLSESDYAGGDEHPHPQLRQPAWILGARMLFVGLDGTARFNTLLRSDPSTPLTSDLVSVELAGATYSISSSRPFLAFMSENQESIAQGPGTLDVLAARRNQHPAQRDINASSPFAFGKQVRAWYRSVALSSYPHAVRPLLRSLVRSLGTGPWLAGLWWGDSQLGLLAVWMGHALAAKTWEGAGSAAGPALPLDYYLYSAFTENPGNQCLLHAGANCRACLQHCSDNPLPESAYWLPSWAFFGEEDDPQASCVPANASCGEVGFQDVIATYASRTVEGLWDDVETALAASSGSTSSIFDLLAQAAQRRLLV